MIAGIGTDIIEISRVLQKIENTSGFRERVFSAEEIAYCESKKNRGEHYAARFAAKEALLKALGQGLTGPVSWREISVSRDPLGKPFFVFEGATLDFFEKKSFAGIHLSISHAREAAVAFVVLELRGAG